MNQMLTTVGAVAAVAKVASTAYHYAENFGVFSREEKVEAETRSVEVAENQSAGVGIPLFNGIGYEIWSSTMKSLFVSQDLWDMVNGGYIEEELSVEVLREVRKKDAMALLFIQQAIHKSVFSCIAGASNSKEAWDALQKKYQNPQNCVDESSVLSCPADATQCSEAWDALEMESRGYTVDEPNQKKAVSELDPQLGHKANTKVVEANRIGKESGDIKNNNCGSKKASRGISSRGGRRGKGRGHIDIDNKRGGHRGHSNNNQGGRGGLDDGCFNSNNGHSGGIDNGHFNKGSEAAAADYNSKNAKSESPSSCTTNATETKEALDAHTLQQGHQANTEVLNLKAQVHAQPQAGNPNGGVSQSLTTLLVGNLDENVTDLQLLGIFIHFGQVVSYSVCRDMTTQCSLGYGYVAYGNPQDADRALKELNFTSLNGKPIQIMYLQQDSTEHESGGFNTKQNDYGGTDSGCFNNPDSQLSCYNSKNPKFESVSYCTTNATESREASDAPQQGRQANTQDLNLMEQVKAQLQVVNPSVGNILIKNLDKAIDDRALHAIFSAFGNILSCKVETDASGQSMGYGHIEYDSEEAAQEAIEKVNGMLLNHKKVYVAPFVSKQEKGKAREMTKSTNVYVGNLSESTTEEDLRDVFGYFGTLVSIVVMRDGDGKSKCLGFVKFKDADDASWCIDVLNGHKFDNKEWCVRRASQKKRGRRAKKKSVPSPTANASDSKKAGNAVSEKKITGKPQKKSVPSSTAKATESKKSGYAVSQKKFKARVQKKSVPSSIANETESKKAVEAVQKTSLLGLLDVAARAAGNYGGPKVVVTARAAEKYGGPKVDVAARTAGKYGCPKVAVTTVVLLDGMGSPYGLKKIDMAEGREERRRREKGFTPKLYGFAFFDGFAGVW
nr:polyadenylate-binding protein 2-like isoform X1 [Ipomoea batatas]